MNAKVNLKVNERVNGKQKGVSFYVLVRPDTDEFFDDCQQTVLGMSTKWVEHLEQAQRYTSFDLARQAAIFLCSSGSFALEVCSVRGIRGEWCVDTESEFFPAGAMSLAV